MIIFADKRLKKRFEETKIKKNLRNAFERIKNNPEKGSRVRSKLIPKEYKKYHINNLWKYNLPKGWRLLYSVAYDEGNLIILILEWLSHKEYERRFKY